MHDYHSPKPHSLARARTMIQENYNSPAGAWLRLLTVGWACLGACCPGLAQYIATSAPVGAVQVTLAGAQNGLPKLSTFAPALRHAAESAAVGRVRGTLTSVTTTVLGDSAAGWTAGALSQAAAPYFLRVCSGAAEGTWWQILATPANTTNAVTVGHRGIDPVVAGVAAGDSYEIVPADTLDTLFWSVTTQIGGPNASAADIVRLHDGVIWRDYHYNTTHNQWREGSAPFNRNNTVLRPDVGVIFQRRAAGDVSLLLLGGVSVRPERATVAATGSTPIGTAFPARLTLGALGLEQAAGFRRNLGDAAVADRVRVWDGVTWRSFTFSAAVNQWREGTAPFNRSTFELPFLAPVFLERAPAGSASSFLLTLVPPYNL